jgi:hypothetical protein
MNSVSSVIGTSAARERAAGRGSERTNDLDLRLAGSVRAVGGKVDQRCSAIELLMLLSCA